MTDNTNIELKNCPFCDGLVKECFETSVLSDDDIAGEWILNTTFMNSSPLHTWRCSECGEKITYYNSSRLTRYCHGCGIRMRPYEEEAD